MLMFRRTILLALGLSLLSGCERDDRPTLRQTSLHPEEKRSASKPNPTPEADAACPGEVSHIPQGKRDARLALLRAAAKAKLARATPSSPADAGTAKPGDAKPLEIAMASAAKPGDTAAKSAVATPAAGDGRNVRMGTLDLVAPKTWTRERPPLNFMLAQFSLPRATGDLADAQLTVAPAGDNDLRSLDRLRKQIQEVAKQSAVEHLQIGGNQVILVDTSGDDGDASGRYRALNAMVFVGKNMYVVNCTGPEKTVGQRAAEFRAFLQTMKPVQ